MSPDATPISVHRDVQFHQTDERTLSLDVYEPPAAGGSPAVLYLHGGAFVRGDKGEMARHALALADRGYVAVESQYRLADERTFPAALVDTKAAIEWMREEGEAYGVDPGRIAVVGYSAGANLAALAAVTADDTRLEPDAYPSATAEIQAVVGYAGIYDLLAADGEELHERYVGEPPGSAAYELASPLGQADASTPPALLLHGEDDPVLDPSQSRRMAEHLSAVTHAEFELVTGSDADHHFPHHARTFTSTVELTDDFLDRFL